MAVALPGAEHVPAEQEAIQDPGQVLEGVGILAQRPPVTLLGALALAPYKNGKLLKIVQ